MKESGKFLFLDPSNSGRPAALSPVLPEIPEASPVAKDALADLMHILWENGLNPVTQFSGYLITEDPTYLPEGTQARAIAHRIGRDKLLETLIELYLEDHPDGGSSTCEP